MRIDNKDTQTEQIRKRSAGIWLLLGVVFVAVLVRMVDLQIVEGAKMTQYIDQQAETDRQLQSPRGTIFDRNGRVLAISEIAKSLYADPNMLRQDVKDPEKHVSVEKLSAALAPYVGMDAKEVQERLQRDTGFVWLARTMDHTKYEAVRQIIKQYKLSSLRFVDENRRYYPNGDMAAQLIGFVGENDKGLDGVEMVLDDVIRGSIQTVKTVMDPDKVPILDSALHSMLPHKERSVRLTIDLSLIHI